MIDTNIIQIAEWGEYLLFSSFFSRHALGAVKASHQVISYTGSESNGHIMIQQRHVGDSG